ncbi:MAG: hypothetical protein NVSMB2_08630 [Chloroflexota bacterium]
MLDAMLERVLVLAMNLSTAFAAPLMHKVVAARDAVAAENDLGHAVVELLVEGALLSAAVCE